MHVMECAINCCLYSRLGRISIVTFSVVLLVRTSRDDIFPSNCDLNFPKISRREAGVSRNVFFLLRGGGGHRLTPLCRKSEATM